MTNNKNPFDLTDPLDIFNVSPAAQRLQAVLDEADGLKRKDDIERFLGDRLAEQVQAEQEELQLSIEREEFDRIEREEMARLSARAKWEASQQAAVIPSPATTPPAPPVVAETVEQRRARWLAKFEAEEKRGKRGALQRVADSEGVDRSNMRKDIDKALTTRDKQKRAGAWISQLVQDGKRKG